MTRRDRNHRRAKRLFAPIAALAVCASTHQAMADGWAVNRYESNPAGDVFFASDFPWYSSTRVAAIGVTGDYARNPLIARTPGQADTTLIDGMYFLHFGATVALFDRLGLSINVPLSVTQTGSAATPDIPVGAYSGMVAGDVRLGARVRIAGHADRSPISLHIGGYVFLGVIPYNDRDHNVTDENLRARGFLTVAGHPGPLRWSVTAGYTARPRTVVLNTLIDDDLFLNVALGLTTPNGRLTIGPELWASMTADFGSGSLARQVNAEAILGIHYQLTDSLLVAIGGGAGISQGVGTPAARGLLRLTYAPVARRAVRVVPALPLDSDRDNIVDPQDECPNEPSGAHPDPNRIGCPLRDTDGDGVFNDTDQCPTEPRGPDPDPERLGCPDADEDLDGVVNHRDVCRSVPQGPHPDPDRPGCADPDDDRDGVTNHQDLCPTEAQGVHPDPARLGCPLPDRDHDSVPDVRDHCPDQPGAPHPDPVRNGCPGLVVVQEGQVRILQQVFFATNRDRILPRSFPVVQAVADALNASPEMRRVSVEGHSDNTGNARANLALSQRRADSIVFWLTHHGVDVARLEAHGYGSERPLVPNDTRAHRAQNRRVEFHIIDPAPAATTPSTVGPSAAPAAPAVRN